jgi:hypothetical protein
METSEVLNKIGQYYTSRLKENLKADGNYATGKLDRSIGYRVDGNSLIIMASGKSAVLLGLSSGRKPSSKNPSEQMVTRVVEWMKAKGMRPLVRRDRFEYKNGNKKLSKRAGRFRKQTPTAWRKAAFSLGKSMLRKGYKGSQVISKSYRQLENQIDGDIGDAFNDWLGDKLK